MSSKKETVSIEEETRQLAVAHFHKCIHDHTCLESQNKTRGQRKKNEHKWQVSGSVAEEIHKQR